jgi:hypothetical protein
MPLGCKACLHCRQIRAGSGRFTMSPSLCNLSTRSFSFIRLYACLLWMSASLAIARDAVRDDYLGKKPVKF